MHALVPNSSRELANAFLSSYYNHRYKQLNMYYDRSGNQYASSGRNWASELKTCIEIDEFGIHTGWKVNLMSIGQANIYQEQEYLFMIKFLGKENSRLPNIKICISM